MKNLHQKAIESVKWTTLYSLIVASCGPLLLIIKARFLTPVDFGYLSILFLFVSFFQLFESFGINQAIIQQDKVSRQESSSLFVFNILFGIVLYGVMILATPLIAGFFSLPLLKKYLPLMSLIILIGSPSLLLRAFMQKELHFKYLSLIDIIRNLVNLVLVSILLVLDYGLMAIITGQVLSVLLSTFLILIYTVRLKTVSFSLYFRTKLILPFLRFGIYVAGKNMMTLLAHRIDEIFIGYFLTSEILGIYHFGKNMLEQLRSLITSSFSSVLFPVLSRLKNDRKKLMEAYHKISHYIAFGSFPVFVGIAITSHLFVPILFGSQWIESIVVFRVFAIVLIFSVLTANVSTSLLYSVNKPDIVFYIEMVTNTLYFFFLILITNRGLISVLLLYSGYIVVKTVTLQIFANHQLKEHFIAYLGQLIKPAVSTFLMSISVLSVQFVVRAMNFPKIFQLLFSVLTGIVVFSFVSKIIARSTLTEFKLIVMEGRMRSE